MDDEELMEALATRFETDTWTSMGQFLATTLISQVGGSKTGLRQYLDNGIPRIVDEVRKTVQQYYQKTYGTEEESDVPESS